MATRFNVADVTLETIRDGEQQNGELTTPNRPSAPDIPGSEENANVAKNQITITSESNFALYEVSLLPQPSTAVIEGTQ